MRITNNTCRILRTRNDYSLRDSSEFDCHTKRLFLKPLVRVVTCVLQCSDWAKVTKRMLFSTKKENKFLLFFFCWASVVLKKKKRLDLKKWTLAQQGSSAARHIFINTYCPSRVYIYVSSLRMSKQFFEEMGELFVWGEPSPPLFTQLGENRQDSPPKLWPNGTTTHKGGKI